MQTYANYRPTTFDTAGLGLDDRQDWLVLPVIQTRDSQTLELSNFRSVLESLGGESDMVEVHRFGHWGPGWYEIILVHPSLAQQAQEIEGALADYPVFDETDLSQAEIDAEDDAWDGYYRVEFREAIEQEFSCELEIDDEPLYELFCSARDLSNTDWRHDDEGAGIDIARIVKAVSDVDIEPYIIPERDDD
jgi:hypothetical protein